MKRIVIAVLMAAAIATWFLLDLGQFLTLEALKQQQGQLVSFQHSHPLAVIALFFVVYVSVTALSIPGAAVMTLGAGAIFGTLLGTVIVSFASTIGATLAFLASRYLLRDGIQARFGDSLRPVYEGIARDGAFYLFSLRLVPAFPFFAVNLLMGLTPIPVRTFYWISQAGMLLGTVAFVNAGTQLAAIHSLGDIATPALIGSFVALAAMPWVARWLVAMLRSRRIYARWKRPRRFDRNMVVIGAGAAGLVSSYIAATVKAKVTLVEAGKMGGDCLNYGCVPSKALIRSAAAAHEMRQAERFGLQPVEPTIDFRKVIARVRQIITAIEPHDSVERYTDLGVDVVQGYGRIIDPWTVEITGDDGKISRLTTRSIVIAAGASPIVPDLPGLAQSGYLTSDTLWEHLETLGSIPRRIVVLGGGPIGTELSQAMARLGAEVTQVEQGPRILPREDEDVSDAAKAGLMASGVTVLTGHRALEIERTGEGCRVIVEAAGQRTELGCDALIVAVGRKARLSGYGLEDLGITTDGTIVTDSYLATVFPNIFAAGDVAGPYQFTHVAAHQAWYASVNALFGQFRKFKADYRVIPATTFIDPEVSRVGLNEREAREKGIAFETTIYPLHDLDRAIAESATTGFVKVLTQPGKDRILGVTIVGQHSGELLAEYVLAMKHGLGLNKILGTIHTYPTMAEANKYAAGEWKRSHAPQGLLKLVERYHAWRRR